MTAQTATDPGAGRASEPFHSVLVPLDGSELALEALAPAQAIADGFGVPVEAVTVADGDGWFTEPGARDRLDAAGVGLRVLAGHDPAPAIVRHAEDPALDLVCMATHGHGRLVGALVGSVAESVLRRSARPLVAVGPGVREARLGPDPVPPLSVPRLVACVDGSEASEGVLPTAAAWADTLGMDLTILVVVEPAPLSPLPLGSGPRPAHVTAAEADDLVARLVDRWSDAAPGVSGMVARDPIGPAAGVRAHLRQQPAGLLALGTHARTGVRRVWAGATAATIVHESPIPALVVPVP